ncbi:redox-sensing transcriptional repressor Rex [Thermotoga sp. KOL6]|uniref:redox-sensing transcriptional repressor Rex n=1 Tax=Thermotoga sp. KOL6 TaxID=126741 RepID=UPI000C758227|nr:redox-sensing transcriptional repressor Rex [Thermotoga sp. KOL6]PLV58758.1 redox-sensing transcriptional repressor rex [Thermotoga sp. KOL6]
MAGKIPKPVSKRLVSYYMCLERLLEEGEEVVSSEELAQRLDLKASQIRKDLSYFGEFGKRGVGYNVEHLYNAIGEILGVKKEWKLVVVGAGNIGRAVANYAVMRERGFKIVGIFDKDPSKVGKEIAPGLTVMDVKNLEEFVKENGVEIGVIAVPADRAQEIAERLEESGVKGILNFAPVKIKVSIPIENIDITAALRVLTFEIVRRNK